MKKKVLIHTIFYQNYNYGGILQAFALYYKLTNLGFECEELNYTTAIDNKLRRLFVRGYRIIEIIRDPKHYRKIRRANREGLMLHKKYIEKFGKDSLKEVFEKFMNKEFKSTKVYNPDTIRSMEKEYDYYVVGGDQVWNPDWTDKNFFFDFSNSGKKIAYSCSAGKNFITNADLKKINSYISNIDVISVREKNFSEVLNSIRVVNQVISDPVFLLSKTEWKAFSNDKYTLPNEYIFAYLLGQDKKRRDIIAKFAKTNNLCLVIIPHVFRKYNVNDENFGDVQITDAGPREFVSLISNAKYVLTDSFHGTAFSIIFEKQFYNFSRFSRTDKRNLNARLENIVEEFGIQDRLIDIEKLHEQELDKCIDYSTLTKITLKKKEAAESFLNDNMI